MRVSEAIKEMSKMYLQRTIDSFTKDFPRGIEEERSREIILRNVNELTDPNRVEAALTKDASFADTLLYSLVLESLVLSPDAAADEETIAKAVIDMEKRVIDLADQPDALRYEDPHSVDVMKSVLEVALEDELVSSDELRLLHRLREKLRISERSKYVIMAQLGHFPRSGNSIHSLSEITNVLNGLQKTGVVFYCNRLGNGTYVIPDEVLPTVKKVLGIELSEDSFGLMLDELMTTQLKALLESNGLPTSGTKNDRAQRIIASGLKPSECLDNLSNDELYQLCKGLPGAKVSGTKQQRAERVIDYFASLVSKHVSDEASPGELYYEYLVELAHRDRENLLANKVIKKDLHMESAFEEGTRHCFTEILGLELIPMSGSEHPDGCFRFGRHKDLLMWDNKSQETDYSFPNSHLRQFKRYIRDSEERVACFLVIVPEVLPVAEENAVRLKFESGSDTDISIIKAEDLRYMAETWRQRSGDKRFNAEILNVTGILTRRIIDQRMKLLA